MKTPIVFYQIIYDISIYISDQFISILQDDKIQDLFKKFLSQMKKLELANISSPISLSNINYNESLKQNQP